MKLFIVSIFIILLNYVGFVKVLQASFFYYFSPAILFMKEASLNTQDFLILFTNIDEIRKENTKLKLLLHDMKTINTQKVVEYLNQREETSLNDYYKSSDLSKNNQILIKKIIHYDPNASLLILENNNNENIREEDLVLIKENLVGVVSKNLGKIVEVKLLSSKDFQLNTIIVNKSDMKIKTILGSESGDSLVINNILTTEEVGVGDIVVTSNTNKKVLPNLIIGNVQRIEGISSQTFRKAYLEKNYDLGLQNYVGVLKNE